MNETYLWTRPTLTDRRYALRRDEQEVGRVEFQGLCTTIAHVTAGGAAWVFHRAGLLKPVVTVRREGETEDLIVAVRDGGSSELTIVGTDAYHWKITSVRRGEFAWLDHDGAMLIHYRPRISSSIEQEITVLSDALGEQRLQRRRAARAVSK